MYRVSLFIRIGLLGLPSIKRNKEEKKRKASRFRFIDMLNDQLRMLGRQLFSSRSDTSARGSNLAGGLADNQCTHDRVQFNTNLTGLLDGDERVSWHTLLVHTPHSSGGGGPYENTLSRLVDGTRNTLPNKEALPCFPNIGVLRYMFHRNQSWCAALP